MDTANLTSEALSPLRRKCGFKPMPCSFQINADQVLRLIVDHGRSFIVMKPTSHDQNSHIICFVNQPMGVINSA